MIETYYEYIKIVETADTGKTKRWGIYNLKSNDILGGISWHGPWRQYVFVPATSGTIFSAGCLDDIRSFITEQMAARI